MRRTSVPLQKISSRTKNPDRIRDRFHDRRDKDKRDRPCSENGIEVLMLSINRLDI